MNKKHLKLILLAIVLGGVSYLGFQLGSKIIEKDTITKRIETIPEFNFFKLDNAQFNKQDLKKELPTVFIYFNSKCDYCEHEARDISTNVEGLKDIQIVFISPEPIEVIQQFSENYQLNNISNITFLNDNTNHFYTQFGASSIPYVVIYNKEQQLIKAHKGQLNTKGILKALNQNE
jgi:peroxiredoxin